MGDSLAYYISWKHEWNKADALGKEHYKANCQVELDRLEAEHPEYVGKNCACHGYPKCVGPNS